MLRHMGFLALGAVLAVGIMGCQTSNQSDDNWSSWADSRANQYSISVPADRPINEVVRPGYSPDMTGTASER
jgi:hypothetical protein